jgi:hypothetical protein
MERLTNLVGRGSRVTQRLNEEILYGTRMRLVGLQHAPTCPTKLKAWLRLNLLRLRSRSRGPAFDQTIRWLLVSPVVTALVPNLIAHPRLHGSAALRTSDSNGGRRATAPRNSLGLFGASPHQWPGDVQHPSFRQFVLPSVRS